MKAVVVPSEGSPELDQEAMIMMIPGYLWEVLTLQAAAEGTSPGMVLDQALRMYLEAKGSKEAVEKLWQVACGRQIG